jgi:mRNA-degrading endonuclease RelE of RelBE toxin-antitoxin system
MTVLLTPDAQANFPSRAPFALGCSGSSNGSGVGPKCLAKPLPGDWAGHFRIRTGDWRVIFRVVTPQIVVVRIKHRSEVYED